jgi:hypothetical protein
MSRLSRIGMPFLAPAPLANANAEDHRVPLPNLPQAQGEQCVEETSYMRRNHPRLLQHQRDETTRKGVRDPKHSLVGCVDCHMAAPQGPDLRPGAQEPFCKTCHMYAGVRIDCFQCHSAKPSTDPGFRHPLVSPAMQSAKDAHDGPSSARLLNDLAAARAAEDQEHE